jgi:hypothetical protein
MAPSKWSMTNEGSTAMTEPYESSTLTVADFTQLDQTHLAMDLMAAGVPLTLLLDLATALDSHEVYDREPGSADWLVAHVA